MEEFSLDKIKQTNKLLAKVPGLFKTIDYWYINFNGGDPYTTRDKIVEGTYVYFYRDSGFNGLFVHFVAINVTEKIEFDSGVYRWFDNFFEPVE